jgi:hypothetical protein
MAEPQYPLFDAIGRPEPRPRSDRSLFVRLGAYLVQVGAIGTTLWLSTTASEWSGHHWLLLGACGLVAVLSGFVLIWPLARVVGEALGKLLARAEWRSLWVAPPPLPPGRRPEESSSPAPPRASAPHLRLVWDRSKAERDGTAP